MDDDASELIFQLCTQVGMIMEDASALALSRPATDHDMAIVVTDLEQTAGRVTALVAAAKALL